MSFGVQETKVEALNKVPIPKDVSRFVRGFSVLDKTLTLLTRAGEDWIWGLTQQEAFIALKSSTRFDTSVEAARC